MPDSNSLPSDSRGKRIDVVVLVAWTCVTFCLLFFYFYSDEEELRRYNLNNAPESILAWPGQHGSSAPYELSIEREDIFLILERMESTVPVNHAAYEQCFDDALARIPLAQHVSGYKINEMGEFRSGPILVNAFVTYNDGSHSDCVFVLQKHCSILCYYVLSQS